ncbi:hypothetical protein SLS56_003766 [Neofusicoccum ribis]|uniref:Tat pathway signal sequence n=1 Tax=Neofusicoccum ribis TaxID=45134 RepID=A0ABR3SZ52_9PEZI
MAITPAAYQQLRDRAWVFRPNKEEKLKATRFWVAILFEDRDPSEVVQQTDFLWIKANSKSTIENIKNVYKEKQPGSALPTSTSQRPAASSASPSFTTEPSPFNRQVHKFGQPSYHAPSSPASPRTNPPVTSKLSQQQYIPHGSQHGNDPRIMNAYQTANAHQHAWLQQHVSIPTTPDIAGRTALPAKGSYDTKVPVQNQQLPPTSTALAPPPPTPAHANISVTKSDYPLPTAWDRHTSEERDISTAPSESVAAEPQNPFLQQLSSETDPEKLEKGVEKAMQLLNRLQDSLNEGQSDSQDAVQWLQSIENLKKAAVRSRTVIGVVGNTGAGKSSVINALLDEERLVPTNCMRACTAVVTELSYNESDDEQSRYKADVEFIKPEDWYKELKVLFDEVLDGGGNICKEATTNPDSEAGVAYAKIRAVYPSKTRDQLAEGGLEALMRVTAVNNILGTTKHIAEAGSARFYQKLQTYVDSQEKATGREKKDEPRRMEYWPLIKVVKIYTKADALSTGAVLVDLPGVHDSNSARAAVAEGYMKQCTGLWIVAPITRAVDDKAAKSLLGDSFKRQLKLDGTYGNVTFICSKTDDISIQEAVQSLDLDETAERSWAESDELKNEAKRLKDNVRDCKESKAVFSGVIDKCDDDIEAWEALSDQLADGKTVYEPVKKTNKRKKTSAKSGPQKKRRTTDSDDDFIDDDSEAAESSASDESETEDEVGDRQPLSAEEIDAKIQELRSKKKNAKNQREELDKQTKTLNKEIKALNEKIAAIDHEVGSLCIKGRNDYSRGAIQQDFAAGIKELDQETALDEDEENFNPDEDFRDYDEVARSLPVFCISSRAFQKLSGRLKRDKDVSGFKDIQETGMPQLQAHSKKLTEAGRAANSQKFLNNLSQLLNSIALWATQNGHGSQLTASQQRKEAQFLEQKLAELYKGLDKVVDDTLAGIRVSLTENIYDKYDRAVTSASEASLPTAEKWNNFKVKTLEVLKNFHITVTKRANEIGVSIASIAMLSQQLNNYGPFLEAQVHTMKELMTTFQREVNREFTPVIAAAMEHAYDLCASECGTGTYVRMKGHMASHISANRTKMFQDACDAVKKSLEQMSAHIKTQLEQRTDGVYSTAQRDYLQVLGNIGAADISLSQVEIGVREDVASILDSSEGIFRRIVEGEDDDEASVQPEESHGMNVDSDEPTRANDMVDGLEEERPARGDSYASDPPERDHKSSLASEGSNSWETDGTLIGSDEKENAGNLSDKVGFGNETADTVPAERAILKTLDTNF